ncbi:uncharacterized protein LTR77_004261 [Saxophila tyrrhenica]|uniref:STB6-like N-terminal domain-containing protein n=1 Tax=Saxophila tyrrhenica TaxID=1690608 RepID=A0AAV9PFM3_9PEZI|nr:hypothetical protein LTR77_004261 [Saxophila tyrrhenica]
MAANASRTSTDGKHFRPPRLQTSFHRQPTLERPGTSATSSNNTANTSAQHGTPESVAAGTPAGHQRFVLTDPLAFLYLEGDPSTKVLERDRELEGYECYLVEQWATSRSHPTFTITTYTGDPSHHVVVGVLSVPIDESTWSARLRVYFKALNQYHARRRETPLGILMVTSLSGFPSSLTVIAVPDGDLKKHRADFFVNEDLKRLNCAGRVGLTLSPPTAATIAKFHQLYRTSDKNEVYDSVIELVRLCQSALMLFDKLEIDYADGLLCDVTERAINDWWLEIGSSYYNIEPHDGILGPTTVAGLLGLLMGARNRLHSLGAPVGKDAFDVDAMKKGISSFQKQQRVQRTRRIDRRTLDKLHRATAKAANSEGHWAVPKAVKSTVAELSGKGGEMVMDVVGRRDRAGIAEIETCDMERFVQLVQGERAKWLWYGKAVKKAANRDTMGVQGKPGQEWKQIDAGQLNFKESEHGGFTWTARKSVADGLVGKREQYEDTGTPDEQDTDDEDKSKGILKRTSGFKEARSGIGKFKGAVGLGHHHRHTSSKDDSPQTPRSPQSPYMTQSPVDDTSARTSKEHRRRPLLPRTRSSPASSISSPQSPVQEQRSRNTTDSIPEHVGAAATSVYAASHREVQPKRSSESVRASSHRSKEGQNGDIDPADEEGSESATLGARSAAGSVYNEEQSTETLPNEAKPEEDVGRLMKRTVSYSRVVEVSLQSRSEDAYPRHLSFSLAEESVLSWESIAPEDPDATFDNPKAELLQQEFNASELKHLHHLISELRTDTASFTQAQLYTLMSSLNKFDEDQQTLESMYRPHIDHMHALQTDAEGMLREERERLEESGKEIETLAAKLDYEIAGLKSKVEEVEAGVGDFAKGVRRVEDRVRELEKDAERDEQRGWRCNVM